MESRKVQKVGYSTLTVSLPSGWVKKSNVKPGDLVFIVPESDGSLKVIPGHLAQKEEGEEYIINADVCHEPGLLGRIIIGCYILGRDIIRVTASHRIEKGHIAEIRDVVRKLIGIGVLEETTKSILLQCSIDPSKFKLDMLIRRLSTLASTILSEAMQAFIEKNKFLAEEAIKREDESDTIYYLALRLLLTAQKNPEVAEQIEVPETLFIPAARLILQYLELIADYSADTARTVLNFKVHREKLTEDVAQRINQLSEMAQTIFHKAIECIFTRNIRIANRVAEMRKPIDTEANKIMSELPDFPFLRSIIASLNKIADEGVTIAEIAINRSLERPTKEVETIVQKIKFV